MKIAGQIIVAAGLPARFVNGRLKFAAPRKFTLRVPMPPEIFMSRLVSAK